MTQRTVTVLGWILALVVVAGACSADDVERSDTAIGTLTIATVEYFECTNECDDHNPSVGLIELDEPADPSLAVVVTSDDDASTSRVEIEFIARHLSRG